MNMQILKRSQWLAFVAIALMGTLPSAVAQDTLTWKKTTQETPKTQDALAWVKLGTQVVDYTLDRDVVKATDQSTFSSLKIKVSNGTVNIHKVTVHFADGKSQNIDLPKELTKENDGKLIDLKGNNRVIEKVTFWYDTKNANDSKAVVEVWAHS